VGGRYGQMLGARGVIKQKRALQITIAIFCM